jgi:predicted ATPase with chaperone activity
MRVARMIADLAARADIDVADVAEALCYRGNPEGPERRFSSRRS